MGRTAIQNMKTSEKAVFSATISRYGFARDVDGTSLTTVLLTDVHNAHGKKMADHVWVREGDKFKTIGAHNGDVVEFVAGPKKYYHNAGHSRKSNYNYTLSKCTGIRVLERGGRRVNDIAQMIISLAYETCVCA